MLSKKRVVPLRHEDIRRTLAFLELEAFSNDRVDVLDRCTVVSHLPLAWVATASEPLVAVSIPAENLKLAIEPVEKNASYCYSISIGSEWR